MTKKKRKPKPKTDREVLAEIFPEEIVNELDRVVEELDSDRIVLPNPVKKGAQAIKPWSRRWTGEKK